MLTTASLLAAAKAAQGIPSNYRLARVLDVPETTVQRWNTGKSIPDDAKSVQLAQLAKLDPVEVVAAMHAERASKGPMAEIYQAIAERAGQAAAAAFVAVILSTFTGGPDGTALAATRANASDAGCSVYYVN